MKSSVFLMLLAITTLWKGDSLRAQNAYQLINRPPQIPVWSDSFIWHPTPTSATFYLDANSYAVNPTAIEYLALNNNDIHVCSLKPTGFFRTPITVLTTDPSNSNFFLDPNPGETIGYITDVNGYWIFGNVADPNVSLINLQVTASTLIIDGNFSYYTGISNQKLDLQNLSLSSNSSFEDLPVMEINTPINFTDQKSEVLTLSFLLGLMKNDNIPFLDIKSLGAVSAYNCRQGTYPCSNVENYTYDIYLTEQTKALNLVVDYSKATSLQAAKNVLIASFPNGFGTYESSQGCCSNSEGLGSDNGFLTGAVSMFDSKFNKGFFTFSDINEFPYALGWSDYLPSQYSNSLSGSGYSTYGVNGVFGLWVDVHNKHHTLANTAGTNSPNFTATMLNTVKKSNQLQVRSLVVLDSSEFSRQLENVTWNPMSFPVDDLLAQQSEVQQLAERNLEISAKPWSFYIEPRGSWGQVFKQKRHHGNTFQTAGTRAGFDYLWTNQHNQIPFCIGLGFVGDYLHLWGQRKHHSGNFFANEGLGNFYVTFVPKKISELSVNLIGGGGYCWYTFHRDLFEDSKVIATGKSKGPEADMFFEIEYVFRHKRFSAIPKDFKIAPIAALQYTYSKINAYKETGAGRYNLHVNAQDASNLSTLLGFRTNYEFRSESDISIRPELMLLWQYQYLDPSITSTSSYLLPGIGPDLITATLPGMPHNTLIVGADLKLSIFEYAEVQIDYDFLYNSGFITNVFFLELKGKF